MTEEERPSTKDIRRIRPALSFLRPYIPQVLLASVALIVTASATLSLGQGLRIVIDGGFASGQAEVLNESLGLFAVFILVLTAGTFMRFYFVSWVGERVSADIRMAVFNHLVHLHPGFFEENSPSEIQSRVTTDTTLLQTVIGSSVSIALRNILMFIGGLVLIFITNAKLSLVVLASVPLVVLPVILVSRRVRSLSRKSQDRLADVGSQVSEIFRHIKIVQAFNHQASDINKFAQIVEGALVVAVQRVWVRAVLVAVVMMLAFGAIAVLVWIGGQDVLSGRTSAGELVAFIFYAFIVAGSVGAISEVWTDLQRAAGATERLVELLESPSEIRDGTVDELPPWQSLDLAVTDLAFRYASRPDQPVLQSLSFNVRPGEMVALVGPSGAGKSTFFDLLQRFYDVDAGSIKLGGVDVREAKLQALRGAFGFVPQTPAMFSGTVRDNLTFGRPDASDEQVERSLSLANAQTFVNALPQGLLTPLGEDGIGLSGGQRQRLAVARALIAEPAFLLLDEATSALDAESEQSIRKSVEALKGEMTILVIAHRLSTVRQADRILVFEEGRIIASGTHDELMKESDLYARFASIQFEG
ncbi:MAG: ABC transporter transmembrane domain-containing protein [Pseudomonadota bacterium]|nr:ABC transporter transmembrane domain-containing protein [Pseudomonadota bacterium]MEC8620596.1 ABC transporter transmembrane domain-containing protein [Pseudomonadota bacterium]